MKIKNISRLCSYFNALAIPLILILNFSCFGQQAPETRSGNYRAKVYTTTQEGPYVGFLYALNDSTITLSDIHVTKLGRAPIKEELIHLPVKNIQNIRIRKIGAIGKGAFWGGLLGGTIGGLSSFASIMPCDDTPTIVGSDCDWVGVAVAVGISIGIMIGTAAGTLFGTIYKNIDINGNLENYQLQKEKLHLYLYIPR